MKLHKLCQLFPQIDGDEMAELVADIKANGLRDPIVTLDGEVLDRAAMILKLRSRNTILNRAFRKALTEMAGWARAEAARR